MYRPKPLSNRDFQFNKEIQAALFALERDFIKTDQRIKYSPCANAVHKALIRGDGLGVQNSYGQFPKMHTIMRIEAAGFILRDELADEDKLTNYLCSEEMKELGSSVAVYRYMETCDWITNRRNNVHVHTPRDLLRIYDHLTGGEVSQNPVSSFRDERYESAKDCFGMSYIPPEKEELDGLLHDFCDFVSADYMTPILQAAVVQFQLKALRPFEQNTEQMGRLLIHYVLSKRRLLENITIPFNLFLTQAEEPFHKYLASGYMKQRQDIPEGLSSGERLVRHAVETSQDTLQYVLSLHAIISGLVDRWKERIEKLEKGSAVELLLYEFAGTPIMTTNQAMQLINKSFSTTSNAMKILESAQIVKSSKSINRNKTFEAPDAILVHDAIYHKQAKTTRDLLALV